MADYRPELEEVPPRMRSLPIDRGYPVPWFVQWFGPEPDRDPKVIPGSEGSKPDFRVMDERVLVRAVREKRCWVCGGPRGGFSTFTVGPMCAVNRVSAEPPSHRECAEWSARMCPFLARPKASRSGAPLPPGVKQPDEAPGLMLLRNPGVALCWTTRTYKVETWAKTEHTGAGLLFRFDDDPSAVTWWAEGRPATRAEIEASIESGLPELMKAAEWEQGAEAKVAARLEISAQVARAKELLPA